ncbi:MAG: NAD+ synthase [Candidatus Omnitrophota bacterium]|nr:NAD+ synthase [Candidatus Omnitrophota bacterium]
MKNEKIRVAIAQINPTVGDIKGNLAKITRFIAESEKSNPDIIVFPELAICGYPPEDLLLKDKFIAENLSAIRKLSQSVEKSVVICGFVDKLGNNLYNAASVISDKKIKGIYRKTMLPNYGVFDEKRYFSPGYDYPVFRLSKINFGVTICEDIWHKQGPLAHLAKQGAKLIINISASPYYRRKGKERDDIFRRQAKENRVFIVYNNLVGGQDELVFDGQSLVIDDKGKIIGRAGAFCEELRIFDLDIPQVKSKKKIIVVKKEIYPDKPVITPNPVEMFSEVQEVYRALILGLKDYVLKNGFKKAVVGLSGGIDSSLVAALAVDALGKESVFGVFMPSRYSAQRSCNDAHELAHNLGIKIFDINIENIFKAYLADFSGIFKDKPVDITEENLQARIRGNILMALSNKFGWLVLTTGNKSEVSCGYCTLYGDMAGGFGVIKDVPKTLVYKLAEFKNKEAHKEIIPQSVISREPTAELRPNQKDSETLPPYDLLDTILKLYVEEDKSLGEIVKKGYSSEVTARVISLVDKSEYKRRQAAPGIKITPKAFGRDRRMPITNGFRNSV